jgi:tRNA (mo5U34)-methyltransferase
MSHSKFTESQSARNKAQQSLKEELKKLKKEEWHSPIDLGHGVVTLNKRTQKRFARRLKLMQVPQDLSNKTVLDVGAWDGFFSFEFERRGAKVLATDVWSEDALTNFLFAREKLNSKVEYRRIDVHDLDPNLIGKFDIVFFAGVLYHLRYPLKALESIRSVTDGLLILETVAMIPFMHEKFPMIGFFPGDKEACSSGKHWGICGAATMSWLKEALYSAGFTRVEVKYLSTMRLWQKFVALITNKPQGGRGIIHAFP